MNLDRKVKHIIAVGGGKGGVGKSLFSISIAICLAELGKKVVLADFDLGSANLHTYLGVRSQKSLAAFFKKKVKFLEEILEDTGIKNLKLISGSDFAPGIANPAYWMKIKMIRHLKALPADILVIDLGAGIHYNILDLFGTADSGIIVTMPEPGAIINAYSFVKAALFRKLQVVFHGHPLIGPKIIGLMEQSGEGVFRLDWIRKRIIGIDKKMEPIINEICESFHPFLVVNNVSEDAFQRLINNLKDVCQQNIGVSLKQIGIIRHSKEITRYLTDIPIFLNSKQGREYSYSVMEITEQLLQNIPEMDERREIYVKRSDFNDDSIKKISNLIDTADKSIFKNSDRELWKLRLYFNPVEVVNFLISKGLDNDIFYQDSLTSADINSFTFTSDRNADKSKDDLLRKKNVVQKIVQKINP